MYDFLLKQAQHAHHVYLEPTSLTYLPNASAGRGQIGTILSLGGGGDYKEYAKNKYCVAWLCRIYLSDQWTMLYLQPLIFCVNSLGCVPVVAVSLLV